MKRLLLYLLLLACVATMCAAKDERSAKPHPDLTGTWTRDNKRSSFAMLGDSPAARADETLVIVERGPEIKITRTLNFGGRVETQELIYYTDGRGETNPAMLGRVGVKSKTKWDGAKLVSESKLTRESPGGGTFTIDSTEKWQLSADGKTLTRPTSSTCRMAARRSGRSSSVCLEIWTRAQRPPSGRKLKRADSKTVGLRGA